MEGKKKILIVQETLGGGGAEKVLKDILDVLDYKKFEIDLLLIENKGIYLNEINVNVEIKYIYNKLNIKNKVLRKFISKYRQINLRYNSNYLYKKFVKKKYDVEIAFLEGYATNLISKSDYSSQKIAWVHTDLKKMKNYFNKFKNLYSKFDNVICVSNDSKKAFLEIFEVESKKVKVIYNYFDKDNIIKKSKENIQSKNIDCKELNLIAVGRLEKVKRFDLLIKAHFELLNSGVKSYLNILGAGKELENLKILVEELGTEKYVEFRGFKKNPYKYISKSDVLVMTSDFEGLSMVMIEAMVLGVPVVSTMCSGPKEILNNGEYGEMCECGDLEGLINAIKNTLKDYNYYKSGIKKRVSIFDENIIKKQLVQVIAGGQIDEVQKSIEV